MAAKHQFFILAIEDRVKVRLHDRTSSLNIIEHEFDSVKAIEILGLECVLYYSKLFGLTHACGSNMAANDWQKDCCCD